MGLETKVCNPGCNTGKGWGGFVKTREILSKAAWLVPKVFVKRHCFTTPLYPDENFYF